MDRNFSENVQDDADYQYFRLIVKLSENLEIIMFLDRNFDDNVENRKMNISGRYDHCFMIWDVYCCLVRCSLGDESVGRIYVLCGIM